MAAKVSLLITNIQALHSQSSITFRHGVNVTGVNWTQPCNSHLTAVISVFLKHDWQVLRMVKKQRVHQIHSWSESGTVKNILWTRASFQILHLKKNGFPQWQISDPYWAWYCYLERWGNLSEASQSNQTQDLIPATPVQWHTPQHFQISGIH